MDTTLKIPFYAKTALVFVSVFAFVFILYIGQDIIVPIVYATILAILLNPFVNFLINRKISKTTAISIAVLLTVISVIAILYIFFSGVSMFSESYQQLKIKLDHTGDQLSKWISNEFSYSRLKVSNWISKTQVDALNNFATSQKLSELGQISVTLVLLPVYLFMILYYKSLLLEFIRKLFRLEHHTAVVKVLSNSKSIIQNYLVGLVFEMLIMAVLNSAALLLLGIDYAIILGILGAVLNIIPFIGGIVAIILPMIIAFVTKGTISYTVFVFLAYVIIQFIDNHFIIPRIVASRVKINALISIIVVLTGGALWGVSGMFLSIPLTAIVKVICDNIESLKPWGFLLGNVVPVSSKFSFIKRKIKSPST
jgi:predicted PurR-regulated permease PerM